ncbi:MAG TPA: hypothetical protein ACFYEC_04380 [Candidatus Brocadiaceae bacterium]
MLVEVEGWLLEEVYLGEPDKNEITEPDIKKKIIEYSEKYSIPQDIIANIFIDYYAMHKKE